MYIDPGTGSVLFQVLIAGALGAGVIIKIFWKKIVGLFSKKSETPVEPADPVNTDGETK
ncbi:MAG: hypothetical protein AB9897_00360 [Anaerolineaceae bacterium]